MFIKILYNTLQFLLSKCQEILHPKYVSTCSFCCTLVALREHNVMFKIILQKRLHKELISLVKEPPPGMEVDVDQAEQNLNVLVHELFYSDLFFVRLKSAKKKWFNT